MERIKKLITKKYFFVVFFFTLVVILSFALHITITDDVNRGKPKDDLPRAEATVVNTPDSFTIEENGKNEEMYSNIQIEVSIGENEKQVTYLTGTVPRSASGTLDYGSTLKVKYDSNDHSTFYFANDPVPHYRVFIYVIYSLLIVMCIVATILSSKIAEHLAQKKAVEENMRKVKSKHEADTEAMSGGYRGIDGNEDPYAAVDPFAKDTTDYNAIYEQNRLLDNAEYSAEGTYSSYGNPMDAPFGSGSDSPSPSFGTSTGMSADLRSPGAPSEFPYATDNEQYYSGGGDTAPETDNSMYGMPNASMDAPYDPNSPYSGYGMPNASMDTPYDPNLPYSGYGMPNASMDAPYDPNTPYTGL